MFIEVLFAISLLLASYTFVLYPVLIRLLSSFKPVASPALPEPLPGISIVISAYNEEGRIATKLADIRSLDYPPELVEVVLVSDGSTDRTVEVCRADQQIQLVELPERKGKANALNQGIAKARNPVIVFMDVRQAVSKNALRLLVAALHQPEVGAASGELVHRDPGSNSAANVGLYWKYEKFIRRSESRYDSTVGATGALYAIFRKDYQALDPLVVLDDFETPMQISRKGLRVIFVDDAFAFDDLQTELESELIRKRRTLAGNFQSMAANPWLFNPFKNRLFFQFVSHKFLRLLMPYVLFALLVSSALMAWWPARLLFAAQVMFYLLAILAKNFKALRSYKACSFPLSFVEMNLASFHGAKVYFSGQLSQKWEKTS